MSSGMAAGDDFGTLLRHYRTLAGLTQEQLAERAGLSRRGIADLERGARRAPYAATVERLAHALGLSASQEEEFAVARRISASSEVEEQSQAVGGTSRPRAVGWQPGSHTNAGAPHLTLVSDENFRAPARENEHRTNLPAQSTSFVGREAELARVMELVGSERLVTLTGPGGVGKTRLALETAGRLVGGYRDGVWVVELASVIDPKLVPRACAAVFAVEERAGSDLAASIVAWLRAKEVLLVLDNCEHLIESCSQLADTLLRNCPKLHLLATSRELLGISGEWLLRVEPLTLPAADTRMAAESVLKSDSVKLLADRAQSAAGNFVVTDQNAEAVARICQRLDGMPLALELAAARLRALSVAEVATRLDHRFVLLTTGSRTARPEHQTLRAMVEWSYDLLKPDEQMLFERVAVFTGPWSLPAAEAICSGNGLAREDVLDVTARLVDKSLIQSEVLADGTTRYRWLETLREFALDLLERSGSIEHWRRRHAMYFADTITMRWGPLWWCEDTELRVAELEREYYNMQAALNWLIKEQDAFAAQQLAGALAYFWMFRERVGEGRYWLAQVLELSSESGLEDSHLARASALVGLAHLLTLTDDLPAAHAVGIAAVTAARRAENAAVLAEGLLACGWLTWVVEHDATAALAQMRESLEIAAAADLQGLAAVVRVRYAELLCETSDFRTAAELLDENLASGRSLEFLSAWFGGLVLVRLLFARGAHAEAASLLEIIIAREQRNGSPIGATLALTILSWARLALGDLARARTAGREALMLARDNLHQTTAPGHLAAPIEAIAQVAAAAGQAQRALLLAGAAASLRQDSGFPQTPREDALLERGLTPARTALGPAASSDAWALGQKLSLKQAIAEALAVDAASA